MIASAAGFQSRITPVDVDEHDAVADRREHARRLRPLLRLDARRVLAGEQLGALLLGVQPLGDVADRRRERRRAVAARCA